MGAESKDPEAPSSRETASRHSLENSLTLRRLFRHPRGPSTRPYPGKPGLGLAPNDKRGLVLQDRVARALTLARALASPLRKQAPARVPVPQRLVIPVSTCPAGAWLRMTQGRRRGDPTRIILR